MCQTRLGPGSYWVLYWIMLCDLYLVSGADCGCGPALYVWTGLCADFWEKRIRTITHTFTFGVCSTSGQTEDTAAGLPGLLSFSSLSSRPPETPLSLDWSCTFILSLLLIRHTELLEHMKCRQMLALRDLVGWHWPRRVFRSPAFILPCLCPQRVHLGNVWRCCWE